MGDKLQPQKAVVKVLVIGVIAGMVLTLFGIVTYHAAGSSSFCLSCHSMQDVGAAWGQSQHKHFACIDCHMPDRNIAVQFIYKAKVGMRDVYHETLRTYPAAIKISEEGHAIATGNCLRCHAFTIEKTFMTGEKAMCLKCHRGLVHGSGIPTGGIRVQ